MRANKTKINVKTVANVVSEFLEPWICVSAAVLANTLARNALNARINCQAVSGHSLKQKVISTNNYCLWIHYKTSAKYLRQFHYVDDVQSI